jgi:plasmid stabilization system protein ParE
MAVADLEGIWLYTLENWSIKQADAYHHNFVEAFEGLAAGTKRGRSTDVRPGYQKYLCGSHALRQSLDYWMGRVKEARERVNAVNKERADEELRWKLEEAEYRSGMEALEAMRGRLAGMEGDLREVSFNNALLKKIRSIRPLVADKLWNKLLAAVGSMFSRVRGADSLIVKTPKGFLCNGEAIESLSGSTLDALGLAIRAALCKTFLPHCGFIVLDEPAAACDPERTANLLGFLASVGFEQTLLITHEEISETFADCLIAL